MTIKNQNNNPESMHFTLFLKSCTGPLANGRFLLLLHGVDQGSLNSFIWSYVMLASCINYFLLIHKTAMFHFKLLLARVCILKPFNAPSKEGSKDHKSWSFLANIAFQIFVHAFLLLRDRYLLTLVMKIFYSYKSRGALWDGS